MKNILTFGDSNSWGFDAETFKPEISTVERMPFDVRWPGYAQNLLGAEYRIIEDNLNARTLMWDDPYLPHRKGIASLEESLDACAPLDLVILALGANELKDYFALNAGMIASGMDSLVQMTRRSFWGCPVPKVIIVAPAPVCKDVCERCLGDQFGPAAYEKSLALGALYEKIAEKYGCGFIDCAALNMTLNDADGLHYSREDHAKLGKAAAGKIREMVG